MNTLFAIALLLVTVITCCIAVLARNDPSPRACYASVWIGVGLTAAVAILVAWLLWHIWDKYMRGVPFFTF